MNIMTGKYKASKAKQETCFDKVFSGLPLPNHMINVNVEKINAGKTR